MGQCLSCCFFRISTYVPSFRLYHNLCGPSHPEYDRGIEELRSEGMPMSRFDFADGDEIHVYQTERQIVHEREERAFQERKKKAESD